VRSPHNNPELFKEDRMSLKIVAYMGSPRTGGLCSQFAESALKGAASAGAEVKQVNLVKCSIKHCTGCHSCVYNNHELPIGICPLKDDMAEILREYLEADGYVMACPVYDFTVTSIMKAFIERRFPMFKKQKGLHGKIPEVRVPQGFKKKAALIATGDAAEEYAAIAEPCFDVMSGHFMVEEIDVIAQLYVGHIHSVDEQRYKEKMEQTFAMGVRLAEEIRKARQ
jgi:multimeric flavodoxin WrbA